MARPILRLALRVNRRTRWTAWAIGFACMVLVGSLTLVEGLSAGVDSIASRVQTGPAVYLRGDDLLTSSIDAAGLIGLPSGSSVLRFQTGQMELNGRTWDVFVASLSDFADGAWSTSFPEDAQGLSIDAGLRANIEAATGRPLDGSANLTLRGVRAAGLIVAPPPSSRPSLFPDTWTWVRPELLANVSARFVETVQAVLASEPLDPALVASLGLMRIQTVGAVGFAEGVVSDARTGLLGLGILIAVVIALLVYSAMGLEVRSRLPEIRSLRSLGTSPSTVAAIYEGQAILLAVLGATLGSALGIVLANAVVSFAPLFGFPNLVLVEPSHFAIGLAFAISLGASAAGGASATRMAVRHARRMPEARPS